jgi:hypothetical protein
MNKINYKDLIYVVLIGIMVATITGIAVGTVDYLLYESLGITLKIFYFMGAYFIASYIRRQYFESIVLYQVIAVIVTIYGYFFSYVVFLVFINGIDAAEYIFRLIFSLEYMLEYFNPINIIDDGFGAVLEYLFVFIFGYIAYTKTK